jgi:hypothetical protein
VAPRADNGGLLGVRISEAILQDDWASIRQ